MILLGPSEFDKTKPTTYEVQPKLANIYKEAENWSNVIGIDKVTTLNRIKEKFTRKLENATNIDNNTKYELLQRLQGMKNHNKLFVKQKSSSNL